MSAATASPEHAGGRRRAALVNHAPGSAADAVSLADVRQLHEDRSPESRSAFARKFGRQYERLQDGDTRALTNAILELLIRDVETQVRQALAETVASSPALPRAAANALARDDIAVARPILEHSPVLTDDDLQDIVRTQAMQHLFAIAGRARLSERLSASLAAAGDATVVKRMISNAGALLSSEALASVNQAYQDDREVQEHLARRPALPFELVDQMVASIGRRLEWELIAARRMRADDARQLMQAVRDKATLNLVTRGRGDQSIEREQSEAMARGELTPERVLDHLRDGQVRHVEFALALLTAADFAAVRQMLYGNDKRRIAALCIRAGFATPHYATLRMTLDLVEQGVANKGRDAVYSNDMMRYIQLQYDQLRADAQLVESLFQG